MIVHYINIKFRKTYRNKGVPGCAFSVLGLHYGCRLEVNTTPRRLYNTARRYGLDNGYDTITTV